MQTQTHRTIGAVGAHGPVQKRRITDGQIKMRRQIGACEIPPIMRATGDLLP